MIQAEVWQQVEEARKAKAIELAIQGTWSKWDLPKRKISWAELWRPQPFRIRFLPRSVYDTLRSLENLARWGLRDDPLCKLCGKKGTSGRLRHSAYPGIGAGTTRCSWWLQTPWRRRGGSHIVCASCRHQCHSSFGQESNPLQKGAKKEPTSSRRRPSGRGR